MGITSPAKNHSRRFISSGFSVSQWKWLRRWRSDDDVNMSSRPMMTFLKRLWHLPDDFQWMNPLPFLHRRLILLVALIVAATILWPYSPEPTPHGQTAVTKPANVMQAELVDNSAQPPAATADSGQIHQYRLKEGQTLAQLFRDHNLPVADVFAMAQSEGDDKPLSSLQAGQQVEVQQNAQGVVTRLTIETGANSRIRFIRQADGSYQRD